MPEQENGTLEKVQKTVDTVAAVADAANLAGGSETLHAGLHAANRGIRNMGVSTSIFSITTMPEGTVRDTVSNVGAGLVQASDRIQSGLARLPSTVSNVSKVVPCIAAVSTGMEIGRSVSEAAKEFPQNPASAITNLAATGAQLCATAIAVSQPELAPVAVLLIAEKEKIGQAIKDVVKATPKAIENVLSPFGSPSAIEADNTEMDMQFGLSRWYREEIVSARKETPSTSAASTSSSSASLSAFSLMASSQASPTPLRQCYGRQMQSF